MSTILYTNIFVKTSSIHLLQQCSGRISHNVPAVYYGLPDENKGSAQQRPGLGNFAGAMA